MAQAAASQAKALSKLTDWRWRLNNLYAITDKEGREVRFELNWAQLALFETMHYLNVILKARQLGFSTFILVFLLDVCFWNRNTKAGIVDVSLDDAKVKLAKIRFAYDRMPSALRDANPIVKANATTIEWQNGSSCSVGTSHRGGTLQYLHISELGKIAAKYPEKAREIRTGALNTIQAGQVCFIESTAEGQEGDFFEACETAQAKLRTGSVLTPLDFKFFFFPWHGEPGYRINPEGVSIPAPLAKYFEELEEKHGISLDDAQKAWYAKKHETQRGDMKREYPSTPEEAFEASVEGAIYGEAMHASEAAGRVGHFPAIPSVPVHSFWDIGRRDYTSIWFAQILHMVDGPRIRVVGFYQNCLTGMPHYAAKCKELYSANNWTRGTDYFPHDARVVEWGSDRSRIEMLKAEGFNAQLGTELSLHDGINAGRATIPFCEWDDGPTAEGRKMLSQYRWEWDDARGAWKTGTPYHGVASHGSDAFRTLATSWRAVTPDVPNDDDALKQLLRPKTLDELIEETEYEDAEP